MNTKHIRSGILSLTLLWSACQPQPASREEFVRAYFERYPEATLLDIYKGSFQDTFGPSHLITDREAVIRYIESELKASTSFEELDYQPCGWQGNFYQVNLKVVADGRVPMDVFADAFMASANGIDTTLTQAFVKTGRRFNKPYAPHVRNWRAIVKTPASWPACSPRASMSFTIAPSSTNTTIRTTASSVATSSRSRFCPDCS